MTTDLANAFFSITISKDNEMQIAWSGRKAVYLHCLTWGLCLNCHNIVWRVLDHLDSPEITTLVHHMDAIILTGPGEQKLASTLDTCVRHIHNPEDGKKLMKVQGLTTLGFPWSEPGYPVSSERNYYTLHHLHWERGKTNSEFQYLDMLFLPIYWVTYKPASFYWSPFQEKVLKQWKLP